MQRVDINILLNKFKIMIYMPIHVLLHHEGQKQDIQVSNLMHDVWFNQQLISWIGNWIFIIIWKGYYLFVFLQFSVQMLSNFF